MISANTALPILASSVMQRQPVSLLPTDTIQDAVDVMVENHISAVPIVNEECEIVGIFSLNDLLRLVQATEQSLEDRFPIPGNEYWLTKMIRDLLADDELTMAMSGSPITARQHDPLAEVAQLMLHHQVHHIPIVNESNRLVGVVSSIDFVRLAVDQS